MSIIDCHLRVGKFDNDKFKCQSRCFNSFSSTVCLSVLDFADLWSVVVALLYRIIAQKKRIRQPMDWKKHQRMSMQLLTVSAVYSSLNLPLMIVFLIRILDEKKETKSSYGIELYMLFSSYMVTLSLLFPVCFNYISIDKHRLRMSPTASILPNHRTAANDASVIE